MREERYEVRDEVGVMQRWRYDEQIMIFRPDPVDRNRDISILAGLALLGMFSVVIKSGKKQRIRN